MAIIWSLLTALVIIFMAALPCAADTSAHVTNIQNGDTVVVDINNTDKVVHINNIAAPALDEPFGPEAQQDLKSRILYKDVTLSNEVQLSDGSERATVCGVVDDAGFDLLCDGLAWLYKPELMDTDEVGRYEQAQDLALISCVGIWSQVYNAVPPWSTRKMAY